MVEILHENVSVVCHLLRHVGARWRIPPIKFKCFSCLLLSHTCSSMFVRASYIFLQAFACGFLSDVQGTVPLTKPGTTTNVSVNMVSGSTALAKAFRSAKNFTFFCFKGVCGILFLMCFESEALGSR